MDVCSTRMRLGWRASAVLAGLGLLLVPAAARAATKPVITAGPTIVGESRVGEELKASVTATGDPVPTSTWTWQRCSKQTGGCATIAGATAATYRVTEAELGTFLRVRVRVANSAGSVTALSAPTTVVVVVADPTPTPTPTPTATATPEPTPIVTPDPAPAETPAPPAAPVVVAAPVLPLVPLAFDPFPVVRIKGQLTPTGARVTLLSVRAPRDVRVDVSCTGRDCPVREYKAPTGKHRLSRFERDLRAGTRLEVRVTKPGYIGKFTSILIRRHAEPKRTDRCLPPDTTRPVKCVAH